MPKLLSGLWLAGAIALSLIGLGFFIRLFVVGTNVYWFILSPVIFAVYQFPAVVVYALWKKRKRALAAGPDDDPLEPPAPPPLPPTGE